MFNWKVEEQKLTKENYMETVLDRYGKRDILVYCIENVLSVEEKKEFINEYLDGRLYYFENLNRDFMKAIKNGDIKCGSYNIPKEISKKAWIRRNDTEYVFWNGKSKDNYWTKDYLVIPFGYSNNLYFGYEITDERIVELFHRLCVELHNKEKKYFCEHDEYEILKTRFRDCGRPCFGTKISSCSDGTISVYDGDNRRPITIDELKTLLDAYDKLEAYKKELGSEIHIEF